MMIADGYGQVTSIPHRFQVLRWTAFEVIEVGLEHAINHIVCLETNTEIKRDKGIIEVLSPVTESFYPLTMFQKPHRTEYYV
jgi:hypothetical protein